MKYTCLVTVLVVLTASATFGSPGEYPLIPGTVALWHMNEGSGSQIGDASGNNHYASFNGSPYWPTWDTGLHGGGGIHLQQDKSSPSPATGTGAGAIINGGNLLDLETFTLQMHFNWDGGSGFVNPGDNYAGHLFRDFFGVEVRTHAYSGDQYYIKFLNNYNTGWQELTYHETLVPPTDPDGGRLDAGTWYEFTFIREKQGNGTTTTSIWIDGIPRVSHNFTGTHWGGGSAGFGHVQSSSNYTPPGGLDEARVLDFAIPEPATMSLLALGGLLLRRRRA